VGGAPGARPPKIGKNMIFWRKIVIFHTKYPKIFGASLAIGKNTIFCRKIVIFHNSKMFGGNRIKGPKQDSQIRR
jgi:hypothetical protein